jgi:hypothetical protein
MSSMTQEKLDQADCSAIGVPLSTSASPDENDKTPRTEGGVVSKQPATEFLLVCKLF